MPTRSPWGRNLRWYMAGLCSLSFVVNYIDRTTLSVALPYMSKDIHLTPTEQGFALSAFFITYALAQLPAGALIDKHGVRRSSASARSSGARSPCWSASSATVPC
jgi:ACS family D-galactonate transporter-like MFS transporter